MSRILRLSREVIKLNAAYVTNQKVRAAVRVAAAPSHALEPTDPAAFASQEVRDLHEAALTRRDSATDASRELPYQSLHPASLQLVSARFSTGRPSVNLVLPGIRVGGVFAGVETALKVADALSDSMRLNLHIVVVQPLPRAAGQTATSYQEQIRRELSAHLPTRAGDFRLSIADLDQLEFRTSDFWICTSWVTAHALQVAAKLGPVRRRRCVYLVQDYEPGFYPWSTEFVLARQTYRQRFTHLVNSRPLATFLSQHESLRIKDAYVFSPTFALDDLEGARRARASSSSPRVFFYGRPNHRNLYDLGISVLREAAFRLEEIGLTPTFVAAGGSVRTTTLTSDVSLDERGVISRADYFDLLSRTDVGLSLQHSPHPSHPPLEIAISGALAVTNEFEGTRGGLHENLVAADCSMEALADALTLQIIKASTGASTSSVFEPSRLGHPYRDSVDVLADSLAQLRTRNRRRPPSG